MSIVRRLVEMHGGSIVARSEGPGKGSEFEVRLPLGAAPEGKEAAPPEAAALPARRKRILVVDDNVDGALSLSMMLELEGNEVRIAHDGEEGVRTATEFRPELVFLDIGMPKLDGLEACRLIREQPWAKDAILVALTGWGQESDKQKSREAGFDAHLVKPIDLEALAALLAKIDSKRQEGSPV